MKFLSCEKISEHKYKTPEGYLICIDSIIARTGKQTYKRREVFGVDCTDAENEIDVDRTPEEVFSDKTLASFENKPLTMEHPDEDVNIDNHNTLSVGFARDIKRGKTDKGEDVMLGTLVFTDAEAIEAIENGDMTDLSCGYDCDIVDEDNPCQRNIRGNHIALCQQGRAGIARIVDSVKDNKSFVKGQKFENENGVVVEIVESNDDNDYVHYTINGRHNTVKSESLKNMLDFNGYSLKDSIKDNDNLPEEEDSEFLFRDAYGKEIIVTNWDGKNQFMVVYEGHEQLMNRRDVEQYLDRKGAKFSRVLRDSIKDEKWYDPEYDRYVTEDVIKKQYEYFKKSPYFKKTYEQFREENFMKTKDSIKDAGRSTEQMAKNEIRKLEQEIAEKEYELKSLQKEDRQYGSAKSTDRKQDIIKAQLNTLRGKLNRLKHEWSYCLDSLREPTSSELKKFEDYLIQRHWHVKKLGVTWTGRIHYEVSKLLPTGTSERDFLAELDGAKTLAGLDITYSIGSTGKELKGVVDVDKVYVKDSNTYKEVTKNLKEQAKKEMRDDASFEWMRRIPDGDFEFINGGYDMRFKDRQKYENAKRIAKQVGHTKGHWYDKDLEYFNYSSTQIGNEDSVKDYQSQKESNDRMEKLPLKARNDMRASTDKNAALLAIKSNIEDIINAAEPALRPDLKMRGDKIISDLKTMFNLKDSLKQFKVKYKDSKGRQVIHLVKAKSLADAIKKIEDDRLAPMTYKKLKELGVSKETYSKWTQEQANKYIANKSQKSKTSEKKESNISKEEYDKLIEVLGDTKYENYLEKARLDGKYLTFDIPEDKWKDRGRLSDLFANEGFETYESYDSVSILRKQLK